jgi:SAM-dependent methyltransferase
MGDPAIESKYVLAAQGREVAEHARLDLLQQIFDPTTQKRLDLVQPGWRCLEAGAGRGSIAKFLSEKVGPSGQVIAADIDLAPSAEVALPNGKFIKHNILVDSLAPLGGPGSFDLIHARFLLQHIYDHEDLAIQRMVELLKPGGWLVIEDLEAATMGSADPHHNLSEAYDKVISGSVAAMRASRAVDPTPGRALPPRFHHAGLTEIRHEAFLYIDRGGSPLARWYVQSTEGSRRGYDDAGYQKAIDLTLTALKDPDFWFQSGAFHCAWGRKPS